MGIVRVAIFRLRVLLQLFFLLLFIEFLVIPGRISVILKHSTPGPQSIFSEKIKNIYNLPRKLLTKFLWTEAIIVQVPRKSLPNKHFPSFYYFLIIHTFATCSINYYTVCFSFIIFFSST